jgi:hypothetical protein
VIFSFGKFSQCGYQKNEENGNFHFKSSNLQKIAKFWNHKFFIKKLIRRNLFDNFHSKEDIVSLQHLDLYYGS